MFLLDLLNVYFFFFRLENLLFKLEVLDHKTRERAGIITPTFGSPIPVLLQLDAAMEVKLYHLHGVLFFFFCFSILSMSHAYIIIFIDLYL